jgi:hypothetical protein
MQWTMLLDQADYSIYQFIAAVIAKTSKGHSTAEVRVAIGVTPWTGQGTFAGDLN